MNIEKVSLAVQIDGQACFVALSQEKLQVLIKLAAALFDDEVLQVVKAPKDFKFTTIKDAGV